MAFPTIQTADTQPGSQTSNSNSWTLTYPTNLASGDLILAFLACDGSATFTLPAGWIQSRDGIAAVCGFCAKKISDGTETGNFTLGLSASEQGAWRIFRITGWEGTIGTTFDGSNNSGAVKITSVTTGTNNAPNPNSLNDWSGEDTLWFASCYVDTSRTISVYPLADNNTADVSGGSNGATLGLCTANSAVTSLDPGDFTISANDDWLSNTVAVRPGVSVALPPSRSAWPWLQAVPRAANW